jgi:hypothetical protein
MRRLRLSHFFKQHTTIVLWRADPDHGRDAAGLGGDDAAGYEADD